MGTGMIPASFRMEIKVNIIVKATSFFHDPSRFPITLCPLVWSTARKGDPQQEYSNQYSH